MKKQTELPNMPPKGELAGLCEKYLEHRDEMSVAQNKMETLMKRILPLMEKDKFEVVYAEFEGVKYRFSRKEQEVKITVNKVVTIERK